MVHLGRKTRRWLIGFERKGLLLSEDGSALPTENGCWAVKVGKIENAIAKRQQ